MDTFAEELIDRIGSSYELVVVAAKRAQQLRSGAKPLVQIESHNPLTIALHEIAEGLIMLKPPEESDQEIDETESRPYLERRGSIKEIIEQDEEES